MVGDSAVDRVALPEVVPGVDLVAGDRDLKRLELTLVSELKREEYLAEALRSVAGYYEIIIDCPPNLGLLTVNALFAAPEVVVPVSMRDAAALQSAGEVAQTVAMLAGRGVDVRRASVAGAREAARRALGGPRRSPGKSRWS